MFTHVLTALEVVVSVGDEIGIFAQSQRGYLALIVNMFLPEDTMNNSEVFTKLCGVIHVKLLQYPLTYCFRFQSRPNMELSITHHT